MAMILFAFLAGMSFVIACLGTAVAIAEHLRAEADAWKELRTQDGMIRAVAAASVPPAYPVGQVHIVVPGPRTAQ